MFNNLFFQVILITTTLISPSTASGEDGHTYSLTMNRSSANGAQVPEETPIAQVTFDSTMYVEYWFGAQSAAGATIPERIWSFFANFQVMRYTVVESKVNVPCASVYNMIKKLFECCGLPELKHEEIWLEVKDLHSKYDGKERPTYIVRVFWAYGPEGHEKQGQLELSIAQSGSKDVVISEMQSSCLVKTETPEHPVEPDNSWTPVEGEKRMIPIIEMFRHWRYKLVGENCQTAVRRIQAYLDESVPEPIDLEPSVSQARDASELEIGVTPLLRKLSGLSGPPEERKSQTGPARSPSAGSGGAGSQDWKTAAPGPVEV